MVNTDLSRKLADLSKSTMAPAMKASAVAGMAKWSSGLDEPHAVIVGAIGDMACDAIDVLDGIRAGEGAQQRIITAIWHAIARHYDPRAEQDSQPTQPREWDGQGLPPVGVTLMIRACPGAEFIPGAFTYIDKNCAVILYDGLNATVAACTPNIEIKPNNSARDDRIDQIAEFIERAYEHAMEPGSPAPSKTIRNIAEAMYDAGHIVTESKS